MMRIALGSDHGGYALKCKIKEHLESRGYECPLLISTPYISDLG